MSQIVGLKYETYVIHTKPDKEGVDNAGSQQGPLYILVSDRSYLVSTYFISNKQGNGIGPQVIQTLDSVLPL